MTTIKELCEWAVENHVEDLPIGLQYQDGGGSYDGDTFTEEGMRDLNIEVCKNRDIEYILLA